MAKALLVSVTGVIVVIVAAVLAAPVAALVRSEAAVHKTVGASNFTVAPDGTGPVGGLEWG
jgi:hypothetical protein